MMLSASVLPWLYLGAAVLAEVAFVFALPASDGFRRPLGSALVLAAAVASLGFLSKAIQTIPLAVAYPMWVGGGVFMAAAISIYADGGTVSIQRLLFLILLLVAITGLKLSEG